MNRAAAAGCMGLAVAALGLGALLVCPAGHCIVPKFDHDLLQVFQAWQAVGLTAFFTAVTWLGSMYVLVPAALLFGWYFKMRGDLPAASLLPLALLGAWALAHAGKIIVQRPRPDLYPSLIGMPADLSFPSAHAMQAAAFALALVLACDRGMRATLTVAATGMVVSVAMSRLYLQVHFPSDVLFGLIAGGTVAFASWLLLRPRERP